MATEEKLPIPEKTLATAEEAIRINGILMRGYTQLLEILYQDGSVPKQHLMEIIRDTMAEAENMK